MSKEKIYMAGASVGKLEEEYVLDALRTGWYGSKKYYYCETLEKEFAAYHNRAYALLTNNCTNAIMMLLHALDIGPGDEVLVPECTWIATVSPVVKLGATPVFVDIEKESWCIDPESILANITERTKAVIAVDLFGNMPNMEKISKVCSDYGLILIEDAAEALGSKIGEVKAGKFGIGSCFSFHNTKTMTTGEGGMLLLDDEELYKKCVKIRDHGRGPDTKEYYNDTVGYKFMPCNLQAALGLAQFHRRKELIGIKQKHLHYYKDRLGDSFDVTFNQETEAITNGAWITAFTLGDSYEYGKDELIPYLASKDIPSRPFFYPLSALPAFNLDNWTTKRLNEIKNPVSYAISSKGINLPGALNLTDNQLEEITNVLKETLSWTKLP
jgi:perosamine synthetase